MNHNVKRERISAESARATASRDALKIAHYRALTSRLFDIRAHIKLGKPCSSLLFAENTALLLLNPEFYTAWNVRRLLLLQVAEGNTECETEFVNKASYKDPATNGTVKDAATDGTVNTPATDESLNYSSLLLLDLIFLLGLLRRFPKCYWIWLHRKWCLAELVKLGKVNWQYEFDTIQKFLHLDSRNFHGWEYRRYVVANIEGTAPSRDSAIARTVSELAYTTSKINHNISNFSAWHNRSRLIVQLHRLGPHSPGTVPDCFSCPYKTLVHELDLTKTGMYMDADDTLVWLYIQWLLTNEIFVHELKSGTHPQTYEGVLRAVLRDISELNQLERDEHPQHLSHGWCLKTIVFVKTLLVKEVPSDTPQLTREIDDDLRTLCEIDPLRRGKYADQLLGKVMVV